MPRSLVGDWVTFDFYQSSTTADAGRCRPLRRFATTPGDGQGARETVRGPGAGGGS